MHRTSLEHFPFIFLHRMHNWQFWEIIPRSLFSAGLWDCTVSSSASLYVTVLSEEVGNLLASLILWCQVTHVLFPQTLFWQLLHEHLLPAARNNLASPATDDSSRQLVSSPSSESSAPSTSLRSPAYGSEEQLPQKRWEQSSCGQCSSVKWKMMFHWLSPTLQTILLERVQIFRIHGNSWHFKRPDRSNEVC